MRKLVLLVLILSISSIAYGDTVYLKDGRKMNGRILKEDKNNITFEELMGTIKMRSRINREDIDRIEKGPDIKALLSKKLADMDENDPSQIRAVIAWCKQYGELMKAKQLQDKLDKWLHEKWKEVNKDNLCPLCKGEKIVECGVCGGTEKVEKPCGKCAGAGEVFLDCSMCIVNETTLKRIPEIGRPVAPDDYWDERGRRRRDLERGREPTERAFYAHRIVCPECGGRGKVRKKQMVLAINGMRTRTTEIICPTCKGRAEIVCPTCKGRGGEMISCKYCKGTGVSVVKCEVCRGTGKQRCQTCNETGLKDPEKEVQVE